MECKLKENKLICTCKSVDCVRHGKCCECVANHKASGGLPHCLRNLVPKTAK